MRNVRIGELPENYSLIKFSYSKVKTPVFGDFKRNFVATPANKFTGFLSTLLKRNREKVWLAQVP